MVLLLLVLFTPGLKSLFMVAPAFGFANLGEIVPVSYTHLDVYKRQQFSGVDGAQNALDHHRDSSCLLLLPLL